MANPNATIVHNPNAAIAHHCQLMTLCESNLPNNDLFVIVDGVNLLSYIDFTNTREPIKKNYKYVCGIYAPYFTDKNSIEKYQRFIRDYFDAKPNEATTAVGEIIEYLSPEKISREAEAAVTYLTLKLDKRRDRLMDTQWCQLQSANINLRKNDATLGVNMAKYRDAFQAEFLRVEEKVREKEIPRPEARTPEKRKEKFDTFWNHFLEINRENVECIQKQCNQHAYQIKLSFKNANGELVIIEQQAPRIRVLATLIYQLMNNVTPCMPTAAGVVAKVARYPPPPYAISESEIRDETIVDPKKGPIVKTPTGELEFVQNYNGRREYRVLINNRRNIIEYPYQSGDGSILYYKLGESLYVPVYANTVMSTLASRPTVTIQDIVEDVRVKEKSLSPEVRGVVPSAMDIIDRAGHMILTTITPASKTITPASKTITPASKTITPASKTKEGVLLVVPPSRFTRYTDAASRMVEDMSGRREPEGKRMEVIEVRKPAAAVEEKEQDIELVSLGLASGSTPGPGQSPGSAPGSAPGPAEPSTLEKIANTLWRMAKVINGGEANDKLNNNEVSAIISTTAAAIEKEKETTTSPSIATNILNTLYRMATDIRGRGDELDHDGVSAIISTTAEALEKEEKKEATSSYTVKDIINGLRRMAADIMVIGEEEEEEEDIPEGIDLRDDGVPNNLKRHGGYLQKFNGKMYFRPFVSDDENDYRLENYAYPIRNILGARYNIYVGTGDEWYDSSVDYPPESFAEVVPPLLVENNDPRRPARLGGVPVPLPGAAGAGGKTPTSDADAGTLAKLAAAAAASGVGATGLYNWMQKSEARVNLLLIGLFLFGLIGLLIVLYSVYKILSSYFGATRYIGGTGSSTGGVPACKAVPCTAVPCVPVNPQPIPQPSPLPIPQPGPHPHPHPHPYPYPQPQPITNNITINDVQRLIEIELDRNRSPCDQPSPCSGEGGSNDNNSPTTNYGYQYTNNHYNHYNHNDHNNHDGHYDYNDHNNHYDYNGHDGHNNHYGYNDHDGHSNHSHNTMSNGM